MQVSQSLFVLIAFLVLAPSPHAGTLSGSCRITCGGGFWARHFVAQNCNFWTAMTQKATVESCARTNVETKCGGSYATSIVSVDSKCEMVQLGVDQVARVCDATVEATCYL